MTPNQITYRPIQQEDYCSIEKIISETWNYREFCSEKMAAILSKLYLATCLCNQTFTCVALNNQEPVGVIMGKKEEVKGSNFKYILRQFSAVVQMLIRKEGRMVLKLFGGFDNINKELLERSHQKYQGEVAFFAVSKTQRGLGIGKELFNRVQNYMKHQGIKQFYLYTDTTCNYGFYEHQGMKRICESKQTIKARIDKEISFYLYAYSIEPSL